MAQERLKRTVLLEETMPFSADTETLELNELRAAFSTLFDQTAQKVFLEGLDLDDVIVERLIDCRRGDGATVRVPLPSLSDRVAVVNAVQEAGADGARPRCGGTSEVCAIVTRAILERSDV